MVIRFLIRAWWTLVSHPFVSSGQFSSAICGRCGSQHMRVWY
jgi:hypothetical protein